MGDFLVPIKIIEKLPIKGVVRIADFGCGSGNWVIPLAKKNKDARIYAVDVLSEAISALKSRAEFERVYNIRIIRADVEKGTGIRDNFLDLIIMSNILFQAEDKDAMIKEAHRTLKEKGKLLIVDWALEEDFAEEKVGEKTAKVGFQFIKNLDAGNQHFAKYYEKT